MCFFSKKEKKVVFLIGAGGSSPFIDGLTTKKLTDTLLDMREWEKVISILKERQNAQTTEYFDNIESRDVMHHAIYRINGLLNITKNGNFNFEHLIHLLDKVSIYYHSQNASEIDNIDSLLIDFLHNYDNPFLYGNPKKIYTKSDPDGWGYVPFLAREIIISRILELWNKMDSKAREEAKKLNQSFFSSLNKYGYNSICIYSLNYDPLLYESLVAFGSKSKSLLFETGFTSSPPFFDEKSFFDAKNILAFMHGHVGFIPGDAIGKIKFSNYNYYKYAQEERFKNLFPIGSTPRPYANRGPKEINYNTYFITGLDKITGFFENPFAAYMHRFAIDLSEADLIILIGTSLNDYHLNLFLVNAIKIRISKGKKGKIVFVTKANKEELSKIIEDFNRGKWDNILIRLWATTHDTMTGVVEDLGNVRNNIGKSSKTKKIIKFTDNIGIYVYGTENFYSNIKTHGDLLDTNNWVK